MQGVGRTESSVLSIAADLPATIIPAGGGATDDVHGVEQKVAAEAAAGHGDVEHHGPAALERRPRRQSAERGQLRARAQALAESKPLRKGCNPVLWPDMPPGQLLHQSTLAPQVRAYDSPPDLAVLELEWRPDDGLAALGSLCAYIPLWLAQATSLPIVVTLVQIGQAWLPWTVVAESTSLPGEVGLLPLRRFEVGELIGRLRGRKVGRYREGSATLDRMCRKLLEGRTSADLFTTRLPGGLITLWDGWYDRPGGVRCANDPRGLGEASMAVAWQSDPGDWGGDAELRAVRSVPAVGSSSTREEWASSELFWSYGPTYWAD